MNLQSTESNQSNQSIELNQSNQSNESIDMSPIVPYDWQVDCISKQVKIANEFGLVINTSVPGSGKSTIAGHVAKQMGMVAVILCPLEMEAKWPRWLERMGVELQYLLKWTSVAGIKKQKELTHPYLTRSDKQIKTDKTTRWETTFTPTNEWLTLVRTKRVCFILDEAHKGKNDNDNVQAIATLIAAMNDNIGRTGAAHQHCIMALSGSLQDKAEHSRGLMKLCGLLSIDGNLFGVNEHKERCLTGAVGFFDICCRMNSAKSSAIHDEFIKKNLDIKSKLRKSDGELKEKMANAEKNNQFLYQLFLQVVAPNICSAAVNPNPPTYRLLVNNVYCMHRTREVFDEAQRSIAAMMDAKMLTVRGRSKGAAFAALRLNQFSKRYNIAADAIAQLQADPHCKVIVGFSSIPAVDYVMGEITRAGFNPIRVTGSSATGKNDKALSGEDKLAISDRFRAAVYDPTTGVLLDRVIVCNMAVIATGLDFHDTSVGGKNPRYTFATPDFDALRMHQFLHRTARTGTTSTVTFRWYYNRSTFGPLTRPAADSSEMKLVKSLASKHEVMEDSGVEFNGEESNLIETDFGVFEHMEDEEEIVSTFEEEEDEPAPAPATAVAPIVLQPPTLLTNVDVDDETWFNSLFTDNGNLMVDTPSSSSSSSSSETASTSGDDCLAPPCSPVSVASPNKRTFSASFSLAASSSSSSSAPVARPLKQQRLNTSIFDGKGPLIAPQSYIPPQSSSSQPNKTLCHGCKCVHTKSMSCKMALARTKTKLHSHMFSRRH